MATVHDTTSPMRPVPPLTGASGTGIRLPALKRHERKQAHIDNSPRPSGSELLIRHRCR